MIQIALTEMNADDTGIDDHFRTDDAGVIGAVETSPLYADTVESRLDDGVLLRMQPAAEFMTFARRNLQFLPHAPDIKTMLKPGRGPIVPGGQNSAVTDQNRSNPSPQASGTSGNEGGNVYKVIIPVWPCRFYNRYRSGFVSFFNFRPVTPWISTLAIRSRYRVEIFHKGTGLPL